MGLEDKFKEVRDEVEEIAEKVKEKLHIDDQPRDNPEKESGHSIQPSPP